MAKIFKPNYNHSIINIPASILSVAGVRNAYPKSLILQKELRKKYKNIVFFLFDGLGKSIVNKHLNKNDIMRANIKETLHSVFPPTTTAATTTYLTCSYPSEHGWLGWNMYFEDFDMVVDMFTNKESFTQTTIKGLNVKDIVPYQNIFEEIDKKGKYKVTTIYPESIDIGHKRNKPYKTLNGMFKSVKSVINNGDKNFVYVYNENPDYIMHEYSSSSNEAKEFVKKINDEIEKLYNEVNDTLIIICADHGQIDVKNRIFLHKYEDLCGMLETPPYLDSRTVSFRVKEHKKVEFYKLFNKYFGHEYVLYTKRTIQRKKFFGPKSKIVDNYIGDFIAIATGSSIMQYTTRENDDNIFNFKGHHAGLTKEEVEVPLILIGKK